MRSALLLAACVCFPLLCSSCGGTSGARGIDAVRVATYVSDLRAAAPALAKLYTDARTNLAAGVPRGTTGLEILLAVEQVIPEFLTSAAAAHNSPAQR